MCMKKFVLAIAILFALVGSAQAYTVQRGDTLSQIAKDNNTTVESIVSQNGIQNPDLIYAGQELSLGDEVLGASVPTVVALYEDSLASRITSAATSLTLVRGTDKQDRNLSGYYGFVVDEGSSTEEFMTANCTATACTIVSRGLDVQDGSSEVSALKFEHRRGASVKISNFPQLALLSRIITGQETTGTNTLKIGDTSATTTKQLIFTNGTSTAFRGIGWDGTNLIWSDDGSNTYTFSSSSPSVLSAGDGIDINTSVINLDIRADRAVTTTAGELDFLTKASGGLDQDANGAFVSTSQSISWSGVQNFVTASSSIQRVGSTLFVGATSTLATTTVNGVDLQPIVTGASSDASSLHTHPIKSLWRQSFGVDRYIPYYFINTNNRTVATLGFAETLAGTGGVTESNISTTVTSGATSGSEATLKTSGFNGGLGWIKDFSYDTEVQLGQATSQDVFWGIGDAFSCGGSGNVKDCDATSIAKHVGFFVQDSDIYASVANGTTQTRVGVTSTVTMTNLNDYQIDFDSGVSAKFYVNGTLVATISTNLPGTDSSRFELYYAMSNAAAGAKTMTIYTNPLFMTKAL